MDAFMAPASAKMILREDVMAKPCAYFCVHPRICWDWKTRKLAWSSHTMFPFGSNILWRLLLDSLTVPKILSPLLPATWSQFHRALLWPRVRVLLLRQQQTVLHRETCGQRNGRRNAERNKDDTIKRHWCNLDAMKIASYCIQHPDATLPRSLLPTTAFGTPAVPVAFATRSLFVPGMASWLNLRSQPQAFNFYLQKLLGNDKKTKKKQGITASLSVQFSSRASFIYLSFAPWLLSDFSWPVQHRADSVPIRPVSKEHWTIVTSKDLGCLQRPNKYAQRSFNMFQLVQLYDTITLSLHRPSALQNTIIART